MAEETPIVSLSDLPPEIRVLQVSTQELMVVTARMAQEIGALKDRIDALARHNILQDRIINSLQDQVKTLSCKD